MVSPRRPSVRRNSTLDQVASAGHSLPNSSRPLAQASIARDLNEVSDDSSFASTASFHSSDSEWSAPLVRPSTAPPSTNSRFVYRRESFATAGPRGTFLTRVISPHDRLSKDDKERALKEERKLLQDNNIISQQTTQGSQRLPNPDRKQSLLSPNAALDGNRKGLTDEESATSPIAPVSEATALLLDHADSYGGLDGPSDLSQKWEEAVAAGKIQTTWKREAKTISSYSAPLMLTFLLQYSLTMASIFAVGHM